MALRKRLSLLLASSILAVCGANAPIAQEGETPQTEWAVACDDKGDCKSYIEQRIDTGGELEVWIGKSGDSEYLGVLLPLGIHIPSGVTISFDKGETAAAKLNLLDCKAIGCRAVLGITPEIEVGMRLGSDFAVIARNSDTRDLIGLLVTLNGFAAALDDLRSR